jgi:hypothetical protein
MGTVTHEDRLLAVLENVENPGKTSVPANPNPHPADNPAPTTAVTRKNLFVHYETHPIVFDVLLLDKYGADWYGWEAPTLWREIISDFGIPSISDHNKAKIQAIRTLHINEWYWKEWEVFNWITQALNGNIPDFHVIQKPTIGQMVNSVEIASVARNDEKFDKEVEMFIAGVMVDEGVCYAPPPIDFCQGEIRRLLESLKVDHALPLIDKVKSRLDQILAIPKEEWTKPGEVILHEDPVDIQVAKLKVALDYAALRKRQMQEQLRLL